MKTITLHRGAPLNASISVNSETLRQTMKEEPLLIKATEAAKTLAISEKKLWEMTNQGIIPSVRIGRAVRYSPDALREWVANMSA